MQNRFLTTVAGFFRRRDELSFSNIRFSLWPFLLVFPLAVIEGNLRFYDHSIALAGFRSYELTFFLFSFAWLVMTLIPERFIISILRITVIVSAALLPFQIFLPVGLGRLHLYLALKFFNGLNAACAFYFFCFMLNNVERLFGMALIQFYYGLYYTAWRAFPIIQAVSETWGGLAEVAALLVVVFLCSQKRLSKLNVEINTAQDGKGSGVAFVIGLNVIFYIIMCMLNYIEWAEKSLSSFAFGIGTFVSIGLVVFLQIVKGRSAMSIWFASLALSLLGLGAILSDRPAALIAGSFSYGLGDGLGYIIIYYMCAGAIKRSKSLRMFKLYSFVFFIEYLVISGLFSYYFNNYEGPNKYLAFGIVLVVVSLSLLLMPLLQKKLFDADWTDGLYLRDMETYSKPLAETEELNVKDQLNLTAREEEIFAMLLTGVAPKEIAYTLKISNNTVNFHQKNLYRKLGIQSRAELFAMYASKMVLNSGKANASAEALSLSEMNKKLATLTITDELTKLNNRRSFLEYMNLIWKHCQRQHLQINAIMIDVDHFKKYNDAMGHLEGDKALAAIAKCIKDQLKRETDFAARYGGEEFVCLLPFVDKKEAHEFTKKMVQSVENLKISYPESGQSKYLTISAGVSNLTPLENDSYTALLETADRALYAAKESGRNRAVFS